MTEREEAVWELARCAFDAMGDGFAQLDASANEALSAMTFCLAEAARQNDVDKADFLRACEMAFDVAASQAASRRETAS